MTMRPGDVRWKQYRTAKALDAVFSRGCEADPGDLMVDDEPMLDVIQRQGMWAFVDTKASPPVVHYWHDGKRSEMELAFMLGHELGHVTGRKARGFVAEEHRADEYGEVAAAVLARLRKTRRVRR